MKNEESPNDKNILELLRDTIATAPERTEAEFARTQNSWMACFSSSVFVVETYLGISTMKAFLTPEQLKRADGKLESLKQEVWNLKQQYPEKNTTPPGETKNDLLEKLNVLKEDN